ncbi:PepSY domain-containing protein [Hyphomicrobium sp. 1Nfss2.1]
MEKLVMFPVLALGAGLLLNALTLGGPDAQAQAQQLAEVTAVQPADDEVPPDIIAVQIRKQGYECTNPSKAKRDPQASRPDLPVWILTCENATYRVRLVGNLADKVEKL